MVWIKLFRILVSVALAATVGGVIYVYDMKNVQLERMDTALRTARQFTQLIDQSYSRVQGPSADKARERKESLQSAISTVTQRTEPGWIDIDVIQDTSIGASAERYELDKHDWNFIYLKNIESAGDLVIRVRIHVGYLGVFGTKVPWISDFIGILVFVLLLFMFLSLLGGAEDVLEEEEPLDPSLDAETLHSTQLQDVLVKIARETKELTLATHRLINSSGYSIETSKMNESISRMTESMKELLIFIKKAEASRANTAKLPNITASHDEPNAA